MRVRYTPRAQRDVAGIYNDIADKNPRAAQRVENKIRTTVAGLATHPGIGRITDLEDVRRLPLVRYPYTIFYRLVWVDDAVEILRVSHSARVRDLGKVPE